MCNTARICECDSVSVWMSVFVHSLCGRVRLRKCICKREKLACVNVCLSVSILPVSLCSFTDLEGKIQNLLFLFLKIVTCINALYVMLGFQMRYYKGHIFSAN